jgi:arabinan endo-1,5-alpha-L-arabinosidase
MRNAVNTFFVIALFAATACSRDFDTAYVPFVVNVNAVVLAEYASEFPTGGLAEAPLSAQMPVMAGVEDILRLPLPMGTGVRFGAQTRRGIPAIISGRAGKITVGLPARSYGDAEISLYTINGKRILYYGAASPDAVTNASRRNVANGVYLLSVNGTGGGAFTSRIAHRGGSLYINPTSLRENNSSQPPLAKTAADGEWAITVFADGYVDSAYSITPARGQNGRQTITLREGSNKIVDSPAPSFGANVSVHDPSIFSVNDGSATDRFRVIGSHLASAKSPDLLIWAAVQGDRNAGNFSTAKYYPIDNPNAGIQPMGAPADAAASPAGTQIADVMRASPNDGLSFFASDIHKMPNGKFYHYYSVTSTWKCSAIGLAIAGTADGDYITQGLFVRSAEAGGNKTPDGTRDWAMNAHPNCIDPQAFFDKENGSFYMVYGSWSGGIFIFEMDAGTGLPKAGSAMNAENGGYGRRLIANSHSAIEGPYILYSPESDYYYLFVSFGGLASDGGYNMRVFRSRYPCGPYEDATHPVTASVPDPLTKNVLSTATFLNYGVKIMGGYKFEQLPGEKAHNGNIGVNGFLSPGHNSAWYDAATGKHFLIYHTRFAGRGETHHVRVCEMFVNEDGWLAAAPFRYDGGTVRAFSKSQLSGAWKILSHGRDNNTTVDAHASKPYTFDANGAIGGSGAGTWELGGNRKTARVTIDGVLYKGVFLRGYDEFHSTWVNAFTALSAQGVALWGASVSE